MTEIAMPLRTGAATSTDGTTIGFRQLGHGPGIVLVHGGGQASQNLLRLAEALAADFTLYLIDRRGRGLSGPCRAGHGLATEVADLRAVLEATEAHNVFGLSAGAVIALATARATPSVAKLALYEPPLSFDGVSHTDWVPRYERELKAGDLAAALVTILKGTADRTAIRYVPRFLLVAALRLAMRRSRASPQPEGAVSPLDLIPTIHYDAKTVGDAAGPLDRWAGLTSQVLLLGGSYSARTLIASLDGLSAVLPSARRVTLRGVGHTAADNSGRPDLVARELRTFFS